MRLDPPGYRVPAAQPGLGSFRETVKSAVGQLPTLALRRSGSAVERLGNTPHVHEFHILSLVPLHVHEFHILSLVPLDSPGRPSPELDGRVKFEDLDDWGVQAVLGLTYAFSDDLLLGIVYRSQMDTDLEGNVKYEGLRNPQLAASLPRDVQISWTNPQWLGAGLRYRLDDKTQLYANAGWQEWSKFSQNDARLPR